MRNKMKGRGTFGDAFKFGIGAGLGATLISIFFIFVALIFFIPGILLFQSESKKQESERDNSRYIGGIVLMGLGCLFGVGFGANFFLSALSSFAGE